MRIAVVVIAGTLAMSCDEPRQTPNVLWILAEDIGPEFGSYGYPVDTPHLDRLAAEGGAVHPGVYDRTGLLASALGVDDGNVSDDDWRP